MPATLPNLLSLLLLLLAFNAALSAAFPRSSPFSMHLVHPLSTPNALNPSTKNYGLVIPSTSNVDHYYTYLNLGTPPQPLLVTIDTLSPFLSVKTTPCGTACDTPSPFKNFDTTQSLTYQTLPCRLAVCSNATDQGLTFSCSSNGTCEYSVKYADYGTYSRGDLCKDVLGISGVIANRTFTLSNFIFGCGNDNQEPEAAGVLGLSRGNLSVLRRLGVQQFSYCFPPRSTNSTGFVSFGNNVSTTLQYTPMLQNSMNSMYSQFYYINVTGISVGGQILDIDFASLSKIDASGRGGTVLDSTTYLSTIHEEAYTVFEGVFLNQTRGLQRVTAKLPVCYNVSAANFSLPNIPVVTLHLDGLDLDLPRENTLVIEAADESNVTVCLAILPGGPTDSTFSNVLGNFQQQSYVVEYDLKNSRIGFGPTTSCG